MASMSEAHATSSCRNRLMTAANAGCRAGPLKIASFSDFPLKGTAASNTTRSFDPLYTPWCARKYLAEAGSESREAYPWSNVFCIALRALLSSGERHLAWNSVPKFSESQKRRISTATSSREMRPEMVQARTAVTVVCLLLELDASGSVLVYYASGPINFKNLRGTLNLEGSGESTSHERGITTLIDEDVGFLPSSIRRLDLQPHHA
ncbi:hypothetical protein OUZ56_024602 [Daphnia magna]|uniref:Uncharacterized protein n=1 Tax=Daphnia magna TaxID=35525 RepID=A0ABR0B164_9CRUS|nr:hypothetical protein OUZ56_024602 [Daphnia magna]